MEEYPDIPDTLDLSLDNIETHNFTLTNEEVLKWRQFLLANGCDYRLKIIHIWKNRWVVL